VKKDMAMKWVEALRSGKYSQGTGALNNGNKYCCLGVLCEISGIDEFEDGGYLGELFNLPLAVVSECGMCSRLGEPSDGDGVLTKDARYTTLMSANDNGVSFSEIADWIEINYEKL
jgi:hypothetical protein